MRKNTRYVGLDVHADSIAVAVAEAGRDGEVRSLGAIANRPEGVRKLLKRLGSPESLRVCYEAGPCGYELYWQVVGLGVACEVVAPTLVPVKSGDRVKTDRRDAIKLARCYRAGELTAVWVPDRAHEALRDLVRARESAKRDRHRARLRLGQFLLRHGRRPPRQTRRWGAVHMHWLRGVRFEEFALQATMVDYLAEVEHAAERVERIERAIDQAISEAPPETQALIHGLQALRGLAKLTAATIVAEVGRLSRFEHPTQLMGYSGLVPSEHSSGGPGKAKRGAITKTGNAHLRRVLVESAWSYRHRPSVQGSLRTRQAGLSQEVKAIGWRAQHRLHERYRRMVGRGKPKSVVIAAIARELLGFVWAAGVQLECELAATKGAVRMAA
jgi:transposase